MKKIKKILLTFVLSLTSFSALYKVYSNNENKVICHASVDDDFASDRVLVVLNEKASKKDKTYKVKDFENQNIKEVDEILSSKNSDKRILCLKLNEDSKENVLNVIDILSKRDDIYYVGPDYKITMASTSSNDTYAANQWALDNIDLPETWDFTTGHSNVIVGVIDSGIDGTHPDLENSIIKSMCRDFTSGSEVSTPNPIDANGHGTHVAGIIGAIGNNNIGITGTSFDVSLVSLRVFNDDNSCQTSYVISAINYANNNDIPILNLSGSSSNENLSLKTAIDAYSGLFICTAGNRGENIDVTPRYPACYNSSNLITVGSINSNNERSDFSNYSLTSVDIYVPGEGIYSTFSRSVCNQTSSTCTSHSPNHDAIHIAYGYHSLSGTSMACPYVTGVAALLLSLKSTLTATQIKNAILNGYDAITITLPDDSTQNVKKLNAFKALKYVFNNYSTSKTLSNHTTSFSQYVNSANNYFYTKNQFTKLNITSSKNYNFTISASSAINVKLYNSSLTNLSLSITSTNSNKTKKFTKSLSSGTYYLQTCFAGNDVVGNINVEILNHSYTSSYSWLNLTQHTSYCNCGDSKIEYHVVSSGGTILNGTNALKYQICLLCGGNVERGFIQMGINSSSVNKVTRNGSYILPSGIIVLVEDDYEAFFNGTLEFYNKREIEI